MTNWLNLRPTTAQYQAFAEYLCDAHSWYKHLPLLTGRNFVVFVNSAAGMGRRIVASDDRNPELFVLQIPPEGTEYTDENPRLHYAWKTTKDYHQRFGYLDYIDYDDGEIDRESMLFHLPPDLVDKCSFRLYPYVSAGYFAEAVHYECHADALNRLRNGFSHPARAEVLKFADLPMLMDEVEDNMNEQERDWLAKYNELEGEWNGEYPSALTRKYVELDREFTSLMNFFYQQELAKIQRSLQNLDNWLTIDS